ncbi:hypothetical protein RJ639_043791 [Escallonia herrerae]|uniref:Uncharacterized protein n=1 Tax=Escallonia herrerae TaxID=1293975 RepID=A0AA89B3B3_9ASTE|nr:hypothetical protein RJ639_043791 [Escallonia herrerae]
MVKGRVAAIERMLWQWKAAVEGVRWWRTVEERCLSEREGGVRLTMVVGEEREGIWESAIWPGSFDQAGNPSEPHEPGGSFPVRKSQDAAVGALVLMLKKAPPLRQDLSESRNLLQGSRPQMLKNRTPEPTQLSDEQGFHQAAASRTSVASSGILASRTTADALEELRGYKDMKDLLLRQGGTSQTQASLVSAKEFSGGGRAAF